MATVVRGRVPADELVLHDTLDTLPGIQVQVERVVQSGERSVMPLLWVRGANAGEFEEQAAADPGTDEVTLLADFGKEQLYRMEWIDRVQLLLQMITKSRATILDAYGSDGTWRLRVLFPSREKLDDTFEFCDRHGLTFHTDAVRDMDGKPKGRYGLTEEQYEALVEAVDRGYFEVPRETKLEELAADMDISHQALSERIRRGCGAVVEDALMVGMDTK